MSFLGRSTWLLLVPQSFSALRGPRQRKIASAAKEDSGELKRVFPESEPAIFSKTHKTSS